MHSFDIHHTITIIIISKSSTAPPSSKMTNIFILSSSSSSKYHHFPSVVGETTRVCRPVCFCGGPHHGFFALSTVAGIDAMQPNIIIYCCCCWVRGGVRLVPFFELYKILRILYQNYKNTSLSRSFLQKTISPSLQHSHWPI